MTERQTAWLGTWEPKENEFAHLIWVHRDDAPGHWLSWKEATVKLACAARNSYAKHFDARAIAAAESDWIGRAINAMRNSLRHPGTVAGGDPIRALLREAEGT